MNEKMFHYVVGVIFSVLAIVHAFRLYYGWEAVVAGWEVPLWISGVGVLVALLLAGRSFKLLHR